ncbi:hypothetical protein Tco_0025308 [Tanacetum coccineum]
MILELVKASNFDEERWTISKMVNFDEERVRVSKMVNFDEDHNVDGIRYRSIHSKVKFLRTKDETPKVIIKLLKEVQDTVGASSSTTIDQDAPYLSTSSTTETTTTPIQSTNVEEPNNDNKDVEFDSDTFTNPFAPLVTSSTGSSSRNFQKLKTCITFHQPQTNIRDGQPDHPSVKKSLVINP